MGDKCRLLHPGVGLGDPHRYDLIPRGHHGRVGLGYCLQLANLGIGNGLQQWSVVEIDLMNAPQLRLQVEVRARHPAVAGDGHLSDDVIEQLDQDVIHAGVLAIEGRARNTRSPSEPTGVICSMG